MKEVQDQKVEAVALSDKEATAVMEKLIAVVDKAAPKGKRVRYFLAIAAEEGDMVSGCTTPSMLMNLRDGIDAKLQSSAEKAGVSTETAKKLLDFIQQLQKASRNNA